MAASVAKQIKEATKILSYLARAEKYFDLELVKNGRAVKPLLMIADVIDPLRQISEVATKIDANDIYEPKLLAAFDYTAQITEICNDLIALNPRGLVNSDKVILAKLGENILKTKERTLEIKTRQLEQKASQTVEHQNVIRPEQFSANHFAQSFLSTPPPVFANPAPAVAIATKIEEPIFIQPPVLTPEPAPLPERFVSPSTNPFAHNYPNPFDKPENQIFSSPIADDHPFAPKQLRIETPIKHIYIANSFTAMNLLEAADIIEELATDEKNQNLVLLEHSSKVKPLEQGKEIVSDLRALAPIADSFEEGIEVLDRTSLAILRHADKIASTCQDIAAFNLEGFDQRKRKLIGKFIPHDLAKLVNMAKSGYPEVFSNNDSYGELITNTIIEFAEILAQKAKYHDDRLHAELMSQICFQIAEYANFNELRTKFDLISKKNKLHSKPKIFDSKITVAWLRSVTFVPEIARHSYEIMEIPSINESEVATIQRALELLHLAYIDVRDKYTAELKDFISAKAS